MTWPTMSEYQEAMQSPGRCFQDPQLRTATPALNPLGLPQPITGGFASVYHLRNGKASWAVRCFLHKIPDIRERYDLISRHLKTAPLPCMVGFDYLPEGVRVKGAWFPVLKMDWVDGEMLHLYVKKNLGPRLAPLADRWARLVEALEKAGIAHGDLQHGNILVKDGDVKLIDYDGMFVPALRGRGSHERGHPAYQHPKRGGELDLTTDRFSALVIYLSLKALANDPKLWRFHDEDNLIFRRSDFVDPDHSPVFKALEKEPLADALRSACRGLAPRLGDVLVTRPAWTRPGQVRERHIHKVPVYATREVTARFLFFRWRRRERYVERYEDRAEERASTVDGHRAAVTALAFSPDGAALASGSRDRTLRIWSVVSGRETTMHLETRTPVTAVAFVPNRTAVVAATKDQLLLWNYGLDREVVHLDIGGMEALASDGRLVAAAGRGIQVWELDQWKPKGTFPVGRVAALAFVRDGILWTAPSGRQEIVDLKTGKSRPHAAASPPDPQRAVSPAGQLAVGGRDGSLRLFSGKDSPALRV